MIKKLLAFLLLLSSIVLAQTPSQRENGGQVVLGFTPTVVNLSTATGTLNAATTLIGYQHYPKTSKTINTISVRVSAVNGTLAATDMVVNLYANTTGAIPNTGAGSLGSSSTITCKGTCASGAPSGAAWVTFTGLSYAQTAGTPLWVVYSNANGTPGTNYPTLIWGANAQNVVWTSGFGHTKKADTGGAGTWAAATTAATELFMIIGYSDGTYSGFPFETAGNASQRIYGTTELGVKLVTPPNVPLKIAGIAFPMSSSAGSPTGDLRYRIYTGTSTTPTLLDTTATMPNLAGTGGTWITLYFSAPWTIAPGTTIRITAGVTSGGDNTTNYNKMSSFTVGPSTAGALDASAAALIPWSAQQTSTTDGTNFTDTPTAIVGYGLVLDTNGEFGTTATGVVISE